jgi:hypothetical protein
MKKIDRELYRKAYASLRQWSEAKVIERVLIAEHLSPTERWRRYAGLWAFAVTISPPQSEWQQAQTAGAWAEYYDRIQKFEAWRRLRGKRT